MTPEYTNQPVSNQWITDEVKVYQNIEGDNKFEIKDSGKRETYASGMVRDTASDKTDYSLVMDGPMFVRWAIHLTNGARKYAKRNWMKAQGLPELSRYKESALRHFIQWYYSEGDEDHAAAIFFNVNGFEYVKKNMKAVDYLPDKDSHL